MDYLDNDSIISNSHNVKLENTGNIKVTFICMDFCAFISTNVTF